MDNLDRDIREAQRLGYGVHYGHYKADHPHTRPVPADVAGPVKTRSCKWCGKEFVYDRRNDLGFFCSDACRKRHLNKGNADAQRRCRSRLDPRECSLCGATFRPSYRDQIYCGRNCAARAKSQLTGAVYTCAGCGKQFRPKTKARKYCSLDCYNRTRCAKIPRETEA